MIGVIADPMLSPVVNEFFELFKTPWESYQSDKHYDVVLCCGDTELSNLNTDLVVQYACKVLNADAYDGTIASQRRHGRLLRYKKFQIPIYGDCVTFRQGSDLLVDQETLKPLVSLQQSHASTVACVGYDLFEEVHVLLKGGQPSANASIPTLELHIALLRELIITNGAPLVEIPPVPGGFRFVACLTHDVDHPSIRRHKFDHTTLGFLYRAVFGSIARVFRGRLSLRNMLKNWVAAVKLPFVHLGLARDFWYEFERYVQMEEGLPSTFFVIPFEDRPGRLGDGSAPGFRAARYAAADISGKISGLMSAGCEIGLHGIDAWCDSSSAQAELEAVRRLTQKQEIGMRMHWLYFDEQSPIVLEHAGADYDSTIGYNETVGYRAGTSQVYRPLGVTRTLELPMLIMDTALFFPAYLDMTPSEARDRVRRIIDNAIEFGGVVTVNWHDRSIAPERYWGDFYKEMVGEFKSRGAWFATAAEAVSWFRLRRSAEFEHRGTVRESLHVKRTTTDGKSLPPLELRVYNEPKKQLKIVQEGISS